MNVGLTIKARLLDLTIEQQNDLKYMQEQYRKACNFVSEYVFNHDFVLNSVALSNSLYHTVRSEFGLKAQLTSSVFKTVTARYKTVQTHLRQKPYRYKDENGGWQSVYKDLNWLQKPIKFSIPQADLVRGRDYQFVNDGERISLQTLGKRIKCNFTTKGFENILSNGWKLGTAKVLNLKGKWYLHISATKDVDDFTKDNVQHVVGIDRGLRFLATTFDEKDKTTFYSGKQILAKRKHFKAKRAELQSVGTKSAKRKLKHLSQKENRWMSDVNHQISKTLIDKYGANTLFTLEDLTGISFERQNQDDINSWAFYQLERFLTYKAHLNKSKVLKVSAKYTSQRCPKCGSIKKRNRNHQLHEYHCDSCGYTSNDDRLGAMNIQSLGKQFISGQDNPHYELSTVD